ncbi:MAG: hypothetical protein KBS60_05305 [Phascolarctobacterium sp.]|nr:hypothetical protein [Candidatus Phascolarctobacterium caballi]
MNNIIICAVQLVVAVAAFLFGKYVFPEVKEYIPEVVENLTIIERWAAKFVVWAKEFQKDKPGKEKMNAVVEKLKEIADAAGLDITEDQIRAIAQTAYEAMMAGEQQGNNIEEAVALEAVQQFPQLTININANTGETDVEKIAIATNNVPEGATEQNPDGTYNVYDAAGNMTGTISAEEYEAATKDVDKVVIE